MSPTDLCSWGHSSCSRVRVEGPPLPPTDFTSRDFARIKAHSEMIHSYIWNLPRKLVGSNDENSTPQPIDCPGRAASMSRSLGLNGRSSRRRSSSRSGSGGRYIVFAALQHLLTFYFAFVFFAVVAADVEPPVILVSFIHSVVHGLP